MTRVAIKDENFMKNALMYNEPVAGRLTDFLWETGGMPRINGAQMDNRLALWPYNTAEERKEEGPVYIV